MPASRLSKRVHYKWLLDRLSTASHKLSEQIYRDATADQDGGPEPSADEDAGDEVSAEDVVDAEFEVGEDKG